jgi:heat shock protein HslJ
LLVGCAGSPDPRTDPSRLEGVDWVLDEASMGSLVDRVPTDAMVDLRFQEGELQGRAACNTYGGSYEAEDGSLSFGQLASTEMGCDDPLMALESAYLDALSTVTGYQISDAGLALSGGNVALTFTAGASGSA